MAVCAPRLPFATKQITVFLEMADSSQVFALFDVTPMLIVKLVKLAEPHKLVPNSASKLSAEVTLSWVLVLVSLLDAPSHLHKERHLLVSRDALVPTIVWAVVNWVRGISVQSAGSVQVWP